MSLNLDPRQRAMLEAMHIKLWQPLSSRDAASVDFAIEKRATSQVAAAAEAEFGSKNATPLVPATTRSSAQPAVVAAPAAPTPSTSAYTLQAPHQLYTGVDAAATPATLGAGWLIIVEADGSTPQNPFAGDAGRLLDNMLRAMQLHRHPRVHRVDIVRAAAQGAAAPALHDVLANTLAELQPSMMLAMGRVAAQTLLQRNEPLGQLRGQVHQLPSLHGVPLVVTFDAPYLLRGQTDKARAWADLCLALAAVEEASAAGS